MTLLDTINPKTLAKIKLQKKSDDHFIKTSFSSQSANDKVYRRPTFYDLPDGAKHI